MRELAVHYCPKCGFYLLDIYGHDHYLIRVKCRKCKFNDTIDTALFRTIRLKNKKPILLKRTSHKDKIK